MWCSCEKIFEWTEVKEINWNEKCSKNGRGDGDSDVEARG
jgi:hypothetical protein